ncbi:HDA2 [Candida pseudojiufengensis]|uniref:HDA2 n=1 Tax=Candida pseudojiufengensis TaxID=497109 RepID=UPI00222567CA|nr:HDA2 [Candida pseudojiufengensis]KAI5961597.1 HDA2 [Candida pseudojiufengensis]
MNLMDMLSVDPPSTIYGKMDEPLQDSNISLSVNNLKDNNSIINTNKSVNTLIEEPGQGKSTTTNYMNDSGVYHIPTKLTRIQITLTETLLHLFSETLINQLKLKKKKTSIDSLLEVSSLQNTLEPSSIEHSNNSNDINLNYELVNLCFNKLNLISNHPSLLVDHFIPKKLLLSETNEMKISMSGKLELFNKILDSLIDQNLTTNYPILIVSKNNKELELIEGMILGKNLSYKNSSTIKLYKEEENSNTDQKGVFLNLIQTQQLYNNYMNISSNFNYKFIFSFDSKLDYTNPSIQMLRSNNNQIPIYIPIPIFSLQHLILKNPEPEYNGYNDSITNNSSFSWKLKILYTLVVNSFQLENKYKDFYLENYGTNMKYFINDCINSPLNLDQLMHKYNDSLIKNYSDEKLLKKLNQIYNNFIHDKFENSIPLNLENYNQQFIELCNLNLISSNEKINNSIKNQLHKKRKLETSKQLHFDDDEKLICESYYKLRKLNNEANLIDNRLNKIESDLEKQNEKKIKIDDQLKEIEENLDKINDEMLNQQTEQITNLKKEIEELSNEYNKLSKDTEDSRINYQNTSSEAVTNQLKLNSKKELLNKLNKKLQSQGLTILPNKIQQNALDQYQYKLNQLLNQNKFLTGFFNDKINKIQQERQIIVDNSISTGSSSRPNNRISRDSTPF